MWRNLRQLWVLRYFSMLQRCSTRRVSLAGQDVRCWTIGGIGRETTESVEQFAGSLQQACGRGFVVVALLQGPLDDLFGDGVKRELFGGEVEVEGDSVFGCFFLAAVSLLQAQVFRLDQVAIGDDGGIFQQVAQFPYVAGPVVGHHQVEGRFGEAGQRFALVLPEAVQELFGKLRDILAAFAQGRDGNGEDVQAMVEVPPEGSLVAAFIQVAVGGDDDPEVSGDLSVGADLFIDPFFKQAQQLGLERQRHVADLVQEQGAAVGPAALPFTFAVGAGEGPFHMAEQFAFQQGFRYGGAVDRHKAGHVLSRRQYGWPGP